MALAEAADEHARTFDNAGVDGITHRAQMRREQAAIAIQPQITQRGETHVETQLRVKQTVHLLQLGRDFPLRDAVIVKRQAVEHHGVQMHIHQARHQRQALVHGRRRARPGPCRHLAGVSPLCARPPGHHVCRQTVDHSAVRWLFDGARIERVLSPSLGRRGAGRVGGI